MPTNARGPYLGFIGQTPFVMRHMTYAVKLSKVRLLHSSDLAMFC